MTTIIIVGLCLAWLLLRLGAMDSLKGKLSIGLNWDSSKNITGPGYSPNTNNSNLQKSFSFGTAVANAVAGGADELYSAVTSLAGSASASIDLTAFADILGAAGVSLTRVKGIVVSLVSVADSLAIGTAATHVIIDNTVANALSSQSGGKGWFSNANEGTAVGGAGDATGSKFTIPNGGAFGFGTPAAAGVLIDATHKVIKVTNGDAAVTAKVQISFFGGTT